MVSTETIKMKGKSSVFLALRSKSLHLGEKGFHLPCLALEWREPFGSCGDEVVWEVPEPSPAQLGCTSSWDAHRASWISHVLWPAGDPSPAHTGSWCGSGQLVFLWKLLANAKNIHSHLVQGGKIKNTKAAQGHCRSKGFWLFLLVLGRSRASYALLFAGASPCRSQWCWSCWVVDLMPLGEIVLVCNYI